MRDLFYLSAVGYKDCCFFDVFLFFLFYSSSFFFFPVCSKRQLEEKYGVRDKSIIYYIILNKSPNNFVSTEITHAWHNQTGVSKMYRYGMYDKEKWHFPSMGFKRCSFYSIHSPGTTKQRCSFNSCVFSALKWSIMFWNPLSILHLEKNIPVRQRGSLAAYSLCCAFAATHTLWERTCPTCHMQSMPRKWTGSPVGCLFELKIQERSREKPSALNHRARPVHRVRQGLHFKAAEGCKAGRAIRSLQWDRIGHAHFLDSRFLLNFLVFF